MKTLMVVLVIAALMAPALALAASPQAETCCIKGADCMQAGKHLHQAPAKADTYPGSNVPTVRDIEVREND